MTIDVVGLGAGGHARVMIEILQMIGIYKILGLIDPKIELKGQLVLGVPVLGNDDVLFDLLNKGKQHFFIGVGSVGDTTLRSKLYNQCIALRMKPISVIHPQSTVSRYAKIGQGVTLMGGAFVNTEAVLGENVIVNTGAIVEHNCVLEDHVHIATGARLAGGVFVGEGVHIGIGATVKQGVRIGKRAIVGAGAVVVKDVAPGMTVVGVPAHPLILDDRDSGLS